MTDMTRRRDRARMTPLEAQISTIMRGVEEMGADLRLTDCVTALTKAQEALADYIDGVPWRGPQS